MGHALNRLALRLLRVLPAEFSHTMAIKALRADLVPPQPEYDHPALRTTVWGLDFANPIGLAAGFDKNAEVPGAMLAQGFGFVETGTVTPLAQSGNPRPRLFRLPEDRAVINRMGFNNAGLDTFAANLKRHKASGTAVGIVGANVGKNKNQTDANADYRAGIARLAGLADYLVINVSSPNTPGLRALQGRRQLLDLVSVARKELDYAVVDGLKTRPPLLLKIAPDLTDDELRDIAGVAVVAGLDGLIMTNTTIERPDSLTSPHRGETGGLSGVPLFESSTAMLRRMYAQTYGRVPIIGVGGVSSGLDAYIKIRAGASLVQLYSALVYEGPALVGRIKRELVDLLARDGFKSVSAAVGADHK